MNQNSCGEALPSAVRHWSVGLSVCPHYLLFAVAILAGTYFYLIYFCHNEILYIIFYNVLCERAEDSPPSSCTPLPLKAARGFPNKNAH